MKRDFADVSVPSVSKKKKSMVEFESNSPATSSAAPALPSSEDRENRAPSDKHEENTKSKVRAMKKRKRKSGAADKQRLVERESSRESGSKWLENDEDGFVYLPNHGKEVAVPASGWKSVEMGLDMMELFGKEGGMMIEELDPAGEEYRKYAEVEVEHKPKKKKKKRKAAATEQGDKAKETWKAVDSREWERFHLKDCLAKACGLRGFSKPTPIQDACLPPAIAGKDIVGAAETGSGKTLAFGLPILNRVTERDGKLFAMIILPTRELALQVQTIIEEVAKLAGLPKSTCCLVGGMSLEKQNRVLSLKPPIVIGTPGRVCALAFGDSIHPWLRNAVDDIRVFVLDEADRLVEPGHFRDLRRILSKVYPTKESKVQTFIFSATLTERASLLDELFEKVPLRTGYCQVDLTKTAIHTTALPENLELCTLTGQDSDREPLLMHFLMEHLKGDKKVLVFCNAISYVYRLTSLLQLVFGSSKGSEKLRNLSKKLTQPLVQAEVFGLHSKMRQQDRFKTIDAFKLADRCLMITTDLAARGLDIRGISTVIHFQVPRNKELFVHRSGRTARAGNEGLALCMVGPQDRNKWIECTCDIRQGITAYEAYGTCHSRVLTRCRSVMEVANILEKALHEKTKKSKDDAWLRRTAEETGLMLSDSEDEDERDKSESRLKLLSMYNKLQNQLRAFR